MPSRSQISWPLKLVLLVTRAIWRHRPQSLKRLRRHILKVSQRRNTDMVSLLAIPVQLDGKEPAEILATSWHEYSTRASPRRKEPMTAEWIDGLEPGSVLYDIGANVGSYSLLAAAKGVNVFAFEPGFAAYAALCRNAAHNTRLPGRITPMPILLWDKAEMVWFRYSTLLPSGADHKLPGNETARQSDASVYKQRQVGIPLDYLIGWGLPPPNHIKIDVDGAEEIVLRGAARTLRWPTLQSILIETDGGSVDHLLKNAGLVPLRRSPMRASRARDVSETIFVRTK